MKKLLLLFILAMTLSITFISCGGGGSENEDDGGGQPEVQEDLPLIVEGESKFNIIMADDLPNSAKSAVRAIEYTLSNKFKIRTAVYLESQSTEQEVEVLVGNIKSRGDKYAIDGYSYGTEGYAIKLIGKKVVINGGSAESIVEAIEKFAEDVIGIEEKKIVNATMRADASVEVIQSEFDVPSLKIDGVDIKSFKISANLENSEEKLAAEALRQAIYVKTGAYLEVISGGSGENLILIKATDGDSFKVKAEGGKLVISYAHENLLNLMTGNFATDKITSGNISFSGEVYNKDTSVIYYEYFGAVGDGVTDDFEAIYRAHLAANEGGQSIKGTPGKTYYIKDTKISGGIKNIIIRTNVDWTDSKILIDDRGLTATGQGKQSIFTVTNDDDRAVIKITDKSVLSAINADRIGPGTDKIIIPKEAMSNWDGPIMIVLYNSDHNVYRRRGYGSYTGDTQKELVMLDSEGNVSTDTPLMFDYKNLTRVDVYRLDPSRAITIKGGEITTISSREDTAYVVRNLSISRSYTTLEGLKHYVKGELELYNQIGEDGKILSGACYSAFYAVGTSTDVTIKDCVLTGRRNFNSSYEFSASMANNTKLLGCTQSNFWVTVDENYNIIPATKDTPGAITSQGSVKVNGVGLPLFWGAAGSNYCKNLSYINTQLSRYDAHAGVYNGSIIGCEITGIELTGWGTFTIEDTDWYSYGGGAIANSLVYLRNDYGCTFDGVIKIKDVNAYYKTTKQNDSYLFYHEYVNWYFGYTSVFPSVEIDNLKCYDVATREILDEGYEILLSNNSNITASAALHLPESHKVSIYAVVDADKDGFVDEPIMDRDLDGRLDEPCDLDGDGNVGNTMISYEEAKAALGENIDKGISHGSSSTNLNIVKPPEYIKILNNTGEGSFTLRVKITAGNVSNGKYYGVAENMGGFFGSTKFYYTDTNYFVGTNYPTQNLTDSFEFYH